jgi:single-strand DNA-binding protein
MLNRVILIGRLTRDVEMRYTQSQKAVGHFTLAVDRPFTNAQGERDADFVPIVVWGKLAENCNKDIGKGRLVAIEGRLQIRSYDDSQGIRRTRAEVVAGNVRYLDWPKEKANDVAGMDMDIDYDAPPPF